MLVQRVKKRTTESTEERGEVGEKAEVLKESVRELCFQTQGGTSLRVHTCYKKVNHIQYTSHGTVYVSDIRGGGVGEKHAKTLFTT